MARSGPRDQSLTARFAAELEKHVDAADIRNGLGDRLDPGGDVGKCGERIGISLARANSLMQGIRYRLGPQAR
jgi:hypothetical protein